MPLSITDTVMLSSRIVVDLVLSAAVRDRWADESACEGMTIGGLAHHTAAQLDHLISLYGAAPDDSAPIAVLEHYRRAAWVNSGVDDDANVQIRTSADEEAAGGPDALADRAARALEALPAALAGIEDDDPVLIPWQGWSLTAHDFAVTRLMEMVVHADDLAASIDVATPEFPVGAARLVVGLLACVATDRHGQVAVVRALSRPQRAPASVSAF